MPTAPTSTPPPPGQLIRLSVARQWLNVSRVAFYAMISDPEQVPDADIRRGPGGRRTWITRAAMLRLAGQREDS